MHRRLIVALLFSLVTGLSGRSQTVVTVNFDDLVAMTQPLEQYASRGLHFSTGSYGIVAGVANGDPGNWDLDGTASPYFLGFNGTPGYLQTVTLDFVANEVELDVSRANGSQAGDSFTLKAFNGTTLVASQTITLAAINTWTKIEVTAAAITKFEIAGSGASFHPFGVDNIRIYAVPEPATIGLLAAGLLVLSVGARRSRTGRR